MGLWPNAEGDEEGVMMCGLIYMNTLIDFLTTETAKNTERQRVKCK
ncbi:MAG: hypothetical protein JWR09_1697 [Mucilaginibacter sp.]|nr:hypothetical protein [Mucilaginibacter sp.]